LSLDKDSHLKNMLSLADSATPTSKALPRLKIPLRELEWRNDYRRLPQIIRGNRQKLSATGTDGAEFNFV
jgi:hypothetical protein